MSSPAGSADDSKNDHGNDYDEVPLQYKRPFGAGLHRRAIAFVRASDSAQPKSVDDTATAAAPKPHHDVAHLYLSMVLSEEEEEDALQRPRSAPPAAQTSSSSSSHNNNNNNNNNNRSPPQPATCPVCRLPISSADHAQSFAHQVSLPHSHPPSALDRSRMGLAYLAAHGWDPDARRGLGAAQQGMQYPLKPRPKNDHLGVGMHVPKGPLPPDKKGPPPRQLLDAKKVRKMAREDRKRADRVRRELFGDGRLERYLGSGGAG